MERERAIERMRSALESNEYPRLRMLLIVSLTGGCGFLASYVMLQGGLESIALRYPLALCVAYVAFLVQLWIWLRSRPDDYLDTPDAPDFGAGDSAGSGEWDFPRHSASHRADTGSFNDLNVDVGDDFAIPLLVIVFVVIIAFASLWVVYAAPALFAELLFDGLLAAGLYKRLRSSDARHWLDTALRRTWLPFALTLLALFAFGVGVREYRPDAHSIGEVMRPPAQADDSP